MLQQFKNGDIAYDNTLNVFQNPTILAFQSNVHLPRFLVLKSYWKEQVRKHQNEFKDDF